MAISEKTMQLLKLARCADICDALDSMGLQDTYEMTTDMRPMIPGTRFCGTARTVEYNRTDEKLPYMSYEDFDRLQYTPKQQGGYQPATNFAKPGIQRPTFNPGEVFIVAAHGLRGGICGSANVMGWVKQGCVGVVFDGSSRDTPESIMEELPVFSTAISYTHPEGRIQIVGSDEPCVCAGVLVRPGDVISADDDGVIVVPQEIADEVAVRAYKIQQKDRISRRRHYEDLGRPYDETVELLPDLV